MTRNEIYKIAKREWRQRHRRGRRDYVAAIQAGHVALVAAGGTVKDCIMLRLWVKAFAAGRRWPEEAAMVRIEQGEG